MDLMEIRRRMLIGQKSNELYPVGTDIVTKYIGRNAYGSFIGENNVSINSQGEFVSGAYYGSPVYLPINPSYRYKKNQYRIYEIAFYDEDFKFISPTWSNKYNNLTQMEITDIPSNAAYIRFVTHNTADTNWRIAITRIA